jgi:hypothetical protein
MNRRRVLIGAGAGILLAGAAAIGAPVLKGAPATARTVEVWKSPSCGCCGAWVTHMERAGFAVKVHDIEDLARVKAAKRLPERLGSCHTATVDGYVLEGHVPADDVKRLLSERPAATGLAVPGMPMDAPGMDGNTGESYVVILFGGEGGDALFARH